MARILVSVIVPIYNMASYLRECLDSLERQTLKEIEVIMVNDGSTDNSGDIAQIYEDKNDCFHLINRENGGLSAARNTGIDIAKGEYVYFLDSDDFLADDAIEKLYKKAKSDNLDQLRFVAYTFKDGTQEYDWGRERSEGGYKYRGEYPGVMRGEDFYQHTLNNKDYYPSCCLIFTRREIIEKYHLRFYEGILHEDNLFNFQLTSLCDRVALLHEPLYYRRIRTGSITMVYNWLLRTKAMAVSAVEADKFMDIHREIRDLYGEWQIRFFVNMMLYQWEQMSRDEQVSKESKECFAMVKPLIKKYGVGGISYRLFYFSPQLYRFYRLGRITAGKMVNRIK